MTAIDYEESGHGPTIVLVPGSCSTGAAWRPVIAALDGHFRCVTTSLPGYGGTAERRTADDTSIAHVAEAVEAVIQRAAAPVHLVGHSFGALGALSVALRKCVSLASIAMLEPPAVTLLELDPGDHRHALAFRRMRTEYFAAHASGDQEAISAMIDFYGGAGTFASLPPRVRSYAIETTPVNLVDWQSAYGFPVSASSLAGLCVPTLVVNGSKSHAAMRRITDILAERIRGAANEAVQGAAHFMIATHPTEVARLIADHVELAVVRTRLSA
jgi:pimeloyl-ACP methyl ester carboxylesterase